MKQNCFQVVSMLKQQQFIYKLPIVDCLLTNKLNIFSKQTPDQTTNLLSIQSILYYSLKITRCSTIKQIPSLNNLIPAQKLNLTTSLWKQLNRLIISTKMKLNQGNFTNPSFLEKFALDLIKSRKSNYVEDCMYYYIQQTKFTLEDINDIKNKYNNQLKCTLVRHQLTLLEKVQQDFLISQRPQSHKNNQKCIIYVHGLGSNRMQGFSILPHLPKDYCLLTFDLSGSGKSQGQYITYGCRQKQDIQAVLVYLYKKKSFRQIIIWGRSMGAVASLLFNNSIAERQSQTICEDEPSINNNPHGVDMSKIYRSIKCIVADSPFCSFEQISKDIALNKMSIPTFFTDIALRILQKVFEKYLYDKEIKRNFTPFQIDFSKSCLKPVIPIIFVYSLNDQVVNCGHSQKIIKSIQKTASKMIQKVIIPECGHNIKRPQNVIEAIFQKIKKNTIDNSSQIQSRNQSSFERIGKFNADQQLDKKMLTKNIRSKSYWNFEEQLFLNQKQFCDVERQNHLQNSVSHNEESVKFIVKKTEDKSINQKNTVRKSIFNRGEQKSSGIISKSNTKKRGISLSSTIQRVEKQTNQPLKRKNFLKENHLKRDPQSPNHDQNIQSIKVELEEAFRYNRKPNSSVDIVVKNKNNEEDQDKQSPRKKGILRCSLEFMNLNFKQSSRKKFILGNNQNRLSLGGKKQIRPRNQKNSSNSHISNHKLQRNVQQAWLYPVQTNFSKKIACRSTISYANSCLKDSVDSGMKPVSSKKGSNEGQLIYMQKISSEPNLGFEEDQRLRKLSSRQSIKTIDVALLNNQVNQSLTSFMNKKLQLNFQRPQRSEFRNQFIDASQRSQQDISNQQSQAINVFRKYRSIQLGGPPSKDKIMKQSTIFSELNSQHTGSITNQCLDSYSHTNTSIFPQSHITLRPSSRLYHEKRKRKIQAHNILKTKLGENMKITNERYLINE